MPQAHELREAYDPTRRSSRIRREFFTKFATRHLQMRWRVATGLDSKVRLVLPEGELPVVNLDDATFRLSGL